MTLIATSVFDNTKTYSLTIDLVPPPSVSTTSLAAGQVGVTYSASLAAANGLTPYTWSITAGALPGGLTLSGSSISGTPTAYGTFNFTVQAKDAGNLTATANLSIKVAPAPVNITTTSLPNVVANTAYSATLQATGGATPITWSVTVGSLPAGLTLASNGTISGTPTTAGTSNFTVQAADSSTPALTNTRALSITVIPVLSITTTSPLPNGITSTVYSVTLASTGGSGSVTWSVTTGSLPAGLNLNSSTGAITGTPTTVGVSSFTVQAADSGTPQQKVPKAFSITIVQKLTITTTSLPTGSVTSTYSATLQAAGGTPSFTWAISAGALPAGLTLNTATGAITGTPTASGTANFTAQVTDSGTPQQTASEPLSITITPQLAISTTSLPSGTVNTAYSQTLLTNSGGIVPITWSITAGALPPGLGLNASTGVISGTPTTATGSPFAFTVKAADSGTPQQTSTQALSISIATAPLSVATTSLPSGVNGQAYSTTLTSAGGNPPVTWSISSGSLPSWASLNASTGAITGTPNATGTTTFTVKATDSTVPTPQTATKQLSITVVAALSITTASLPGGTVGSAYSTTVAATGGTTPYTWSWAAQSGSSLPPGLSINSSTGAITGTPTTNTGSPFNVTVTVTDSTTPTQNASANFSITITVATLTVTTTSGSLPAGTVNTTYPNTNLTATGGIPPYSWAVTVGSLPAGLSLSSSGVISGTPTASGTSNFTAQVTDSATPTANTATAGLSITVSATSACTSTGGSESLLSGSYAFVLKGFDSSGNPALQGGVLTFNGTDNNGLITAGTVDMNLLSGFDPANSGNPMSVSSGSYGIGSDQRGCMTITTVAGTQHFAISVGNITSGVASVAHVIDFDTTGPFTAGRMYLQSGGPFSNSSVNGSYAFGSSSLQSSTPLSKAGAVGVVAFDGNSGVTSGQEDFNQDGTLDGSSSNTTWPANALAFTGGSYSVSSNGRTTLTLTGDGQTFHIVLYLFSTSQALLITSDPRSTATLLAGEAFKQTGAPFAATPLSGTYIGYDSGLGNGAAGTDRIDIYLLGPMTSGNSAISGTQLRNNAGTFRQQSLASETYSVSSVGRMTIPGGGPVLYLVSTSQAFMLAANSSVDSGFFQSQSGSPFSASSASGTYAYGVIDPEVAGSGINSGVAVFANPKVNVTEDDNSSGTLTPDSQQSFTYSVDSTGLGYIPASCTPGTNCQTLFYIISPTKAVVMDATSTEPKITIADK